MRTYKLRKLNPNPRRSGITRPEISPSCRQKEVLNDIIRSLDKMEVQVIVPKKIEELNKGEAFDLIRKLLTKRRIIRRLQRSTFSL